jgi:hypothetical protein
LSSPLFRSSLFTYSMCLKIVVRGLGCVEGGR